MIYITKNNGEKMEKNKIYYYKSYNDDFVKSKNQNYKLKKDYKWIKENILYRICSEVVYFIAYIVGLFYCKFGLHVKVENRKILKKYKKQGYFLYGNHTQPVGDVFIPAYVANDKRIYTVVSQANLGVVGIGPILPMLGALPIPDSIKDTIKLKKAIEKRIEQKKCVVIYPEAHVWPYYTKIRPFQDTAFKFPVECNVASFSMTTTYYKRKFGKKPGIVVYVDGPFTPDNKLSKKENEEKICKEIYQSMANKSNNSTYEYIKYKGEKE